MNDTDYNNLLDMFAKEALISMLRNDAMLINNSTAFIASCAYDYAAEMLATRSKYAK
jgi:hypothetical protein